MKLTSFFLAYTLLTACNDKPVTQFCLETFEYSAEGRVTRVESDTFDADSLPGLDSCIEHYFRPIRLPEKLQDKRYKNPIISTCSDSGELQDIRTKRCYACSYDSLSRVAHYQYSGCLYCNDRPFHIKLQYDHQDRLTGYQLKYTSMNDQTPEDEAFSFIYDEKGNIRGIEMQELGVLKRWIKLREIKP